MKEFGFISNLKLRLGWGITGNSDIGTKNTQATYKLAPENVALIGNNVIQGISLVRTSNSRLQWESNESFNTGVDFTLFKGRLSGNVDFYRKNSSHLLLEIPSPPGSPTGTVIINLDSTKIYNRGFEIELNTFVIRHKDFEWRMSGNFATLKNMVNGLPTTYQTGIAEGAGVQGTYIQVIADNRSIGEFVGRKVDFIDKDGVIQYVKKKNKPTLDSTNIELSSAMPKFTFGFSNSFKYKRLSLDLFFDGVYGNKIYNHTAMLADKTFVKNARNALRYFIEDPTSFTKNKSIHVSDRYIEDGSYIRLSTATLNYNFDLKDLPIKSINAFVSGSNLLLRTKYKGYDPDVNSDLSNGSVKSYGIDLTNYPKARTYSFGLNVTF
jgi:iron complex outermembrane receptor protein